MFVREIKWPVWQLPQPEQSYTKAVTAAAGKTRLETTIGSRGVSRDERYCTDRLSILKALFRYREYVTERNVYCQFHFHNFINLLQSCKILSTE